MPGQLDELEEIQGRVHVLISERLGDSGPTTLSALRPAYGHLVIVAHGHGAEPTIDGWDCRNDTNVETD